MNIERWSVPPSLTCAHVYPHCKVYNVSSPNTTYSFPIPHLLSPPYNRSAANAQQASNVSAANTATIKKKRKRADAYQLGVLNETYATTAFPSRKERFSLAKRLDMSPRSVQAW